MKILHFPAYITINGIKAFLRSTSGYGYMTIDIATSIANLGIDVDLLTQSNITKGLKYKNVNILLGISVVITFVSKVFKYS